VPYRFLIVLFLIAVAQTGHAGPWLRDKGKTFSATSFSSTYYLETSSQTYLEYGLTEATTLVGNFGTSRLHYSPHTGYATASIRRALSAPEAPSKWAYELGIGMAWSGDDRERHLRTGLTWGMGNKWRDKSGWITVEAVALWDMTNARHLAKLDTTVGLNFTDVTAGMLQLYTAYADHGSATLAPSLVFTPAKSKFRIQVGAESKIGEFDNSALKIGLWREF
jgi:hypothetical protein